MSGSDARSAAIAQDAMRDRVYGDAVHTALLDLFTPGRRVLDVGCGTGGWVPVLREKGAQTIVGVEFATAAADKAEKVYDRVARKPIETVALADIGGEPFDTIIAADVLEHLVDPWRELHRWTEWATPGAELVVSVPNLRYFEIVRSLLQGHFDYTDQSGLMDRTHLRWFTRESLTRDLATAGWDPVLWGMPDRISTPRRRLFHRVTGGRFDEFFAWQLRLVARLR